MPSLSEKSLQKLSQCHPDLRKLVAEVVKHYDITVVCGHRNEVDQTEAVRTGHSKVNFPNSKHNSTPSLAVDIIPFPVDWNDRNRFFYLAGIVKACANQLGIKIRWGGDFNQDQNFKNDSFVDLPHYELVGEQYASIK